MNIIDSFQTPQLSFMGDQFSALLSPPHLCLVIFLPYLRYLLFFFFFFLWLVDENWNVGVYFSIDHKIRKTISNTLGHDPPSLFTSIFFFFVSSPWTVLCIVDICPHLIDEFSLHKQKGTILYTSSSPPQLFLFIALEPHNMRYAWGCVSRSHHMLKVVLMILIKLWRMRY